MLRDYQLECINVIKDHFKENDRQLIQLPTGAGKTWIMADYLKKNSETALIICPNKELKYQIYDTLKMFNIKNVNLDLKPCKFNIITSQMLAYQKNLQIIKEKNYDHIIIDEAHHSMSEIYQKLIANISKKTKLLGLTATPERLDGKNLLDCFKHLTFKRTILELIENGSLCDLQAFKIKTGQKISKRSSDFRCVDLKELDNETRNNIILKCIKENCRNLKTLIFCLNVSHAEKIAELLKESQFKAECVHGKMSHNQIKEILNKFKIGEIQYLTNCQILTEGFDEPSIECIVIARPTSSKSLYCQMIGRGLRKTEKKDLCLLFELNDNNHNICTFNTIGNEHVNIRQEYKQGIRLTELTKELKNIIEDEIVIEIKEMDVFQKNITKNIFKNEFYEIPAHNSQKNKLNQFSIKFPEYINFLEAAFLIWKEKLKEKYGFN